MCAAITYELAGVAVDGEMNALGIRVEAMYVRGGRMG